MSEHLKNLHSRLANHNIHKSAHHAVLAEHYGKLAETFGKSEMTGHEGASECFEKIAHAHKAMGEHYAGEAEHHTKRAKALGDSHKAAGMNDDDELAPLPEGISRVTPTPAGVRAIIRSGQREIPIELDSKIAKIVGVGTDE